MQSDLTSLENVPTLNVSHLSAGKSTAVTDIVKQYTPKPNSQSPVEMKIILSDDIPVYQTPRRVSHSDQRVIDAQVDSWLKDGIIQTSYSEYASPVALVSKKDITKRLCCDFRKLNEKITRDNFPIPLIDDVLEKLQGAKIFSTLNLANGFFHVPAEPNSKRYTSFVTHRAQFEFNFVPFGICNSPAIFCRYISAIFRDLVQAGVIVVYMDDIPSQNEEEAIEKLDCVLKRAENFGLKIKWEKCQFLLKRINFLGYVIDEDGIRPSNDKVRSVQSFPLPHDKKSLQRFLGLTSYFRRFIEGYAVVARLLRDLLRKNVVFEFKEEQKIAFHQLRLSLISAPVLKFYNPSAQTEIHTDASMHGYGGVLLQKDVDDQQFHPIQFMSRKTRSEEQKYHSYELEVLAIIEALKKWRIYVIGKKI
uniref:RNA-directed DNA polymerase n=1 Tax=Bactrocera latifrons TaxID=174628 RepID=A0A0K8VRE6_BACLA